MKKKLIILEKILVLALFIISACQMVNENASGQSIFSFKKAIGSNPDSIEISSLSFETFPIDVRDYGKNGHNFVLMGDIKYV